MSSIVKLDSCPLSIRNGTYGGMAGQKDGIIYDNASWIVKYPKNITNLSGKGLADYSTSPLSEYIGSNIFRILGFDVHETILGERRGKLVVACKDFVPDNGALLEVRTIKNHANEEVGELLDKSFGPTGSTHCVEIDELMLHLMHNPILKSVPGITERFWEQAIVDIIINNNDRNNGNWGVLRVVNDIGYTDNLAPVFDNGASFHTKISEEKVKLLLGDKPKVMQNAINTQVAYGKDGHVFSADYFISNYVIQYEEGVKALRKVTGMARKHWTDIMDFIHAVPEEYTLSTGETVTVFSKFRKELYVMQMRSRIDNLLMYHVLHSAGVKKDLIDLGIF